MVANCRREAAGVVCFSDAAHSQGTFDMYGELETCSAFGRWTELIYIDAS
jgi:hypothetical protein